MLTEVGMGLSLLGCQSLLVVIAEKLVQEVDCFIRDVALVLRSNEPCPRLFLVSVNGIRFN